MEIKIATRFIILSYFLVTFIIVDVLDITTWRLLLYSIINTVSLGFIFYSQELSKLFSDIIKSKLSLTIIFFVAWAFASYFYAINGNEVIIRSMTFVNFFISFIVLYTFILFNKPSPYQISVFLLIHFIFLGSSSYMALFDITRYYEYDFSFNNQIMGFYPNRNITQAVYLIHLPFLVYVLSNTKSLFMKIIASSSSVMLVNIVFLMGARTSYVIFVVLISSLILLYFLNNDLRKFIRNFIVTFIVGFVISTSILGTNNTAFVANRATTIDFQEESTATRLRYYKYGFQEFFSNPFIGVGIGNWKIHSIGLDSENIRSYVVPYTMHNDLLEVAVELGLIGLVLFSLIFYFTIINLWSLYNKNKSKEYIIIIPIALLVYFIDSMINFPFTRASQLFYLAIIIALSQYFLKYINEESN